MSPPSAGSPDVCRYSPAFRIQPVLLPASPTRHLRTERQDWLTTETEHHCCKSRNIDYYTNQNIIIASQETSTSKRNLKKLRKSKQLTSSPATIPSMVTNDCEKAIWTISFRVKRGIRRSLTSKCSLAVSRAHKK